MLWDDDEDGVEIGGKAVMPARIMLNGDETLAKKYISVGRAILGGLKQQMDLDGLKAHSIKKILPDGTKIHAKSNMWGLSDIDEIWIDVRPLIMKPEGVHICLGYIVQYFTPDGYASIYLTLPDKTDVPFSHIYYNNNDVDDVEFDGYPDNGAKYIHSKDSWDPTIDKDYQAVVVVNDHATNTFGGSPIVYTLSYPDPDPELNPGWTWVSEYMHAEGQCGYTHCGPGGSEEPKLWSQTVNPCVSEYTGIVNVYNNGRTSIPGFTYVDKVTWWVGPWAMTGELPCFNDWAVFCYREAPDGSNSIQPLVDEITAIAYYKRNNDFIGAATALINTASTQGFDWLMENDYIDRDTTDYRTDFLYTMKVGLIVKRTDDRGFHTNSGFYFGKDEDKGKIVLTEQLIGHGEYALFMIPLDDKKRFKYSSELHQKVSDANANWDNGTVTFTAGRAAIRSDPFCYSGNFSFTASPEDEKNASRTDFYEWDMQDLFGVPCKVDNGVHEVRVQSLKVGKVKVYALVMGTDGQEMKIVESELKADFESTLIHIKVGQYDDFSEVVKFS